MLSGPENAIYSPEEEARTGYSRPAPPRYDGRGIASPAGPQEWMVWSFFSLSLALCPKSPSSPGITMAGGSPMCQINTFPAQRSGRYESLQIYRRRPSKRRSAVCCCGEGRRGDLLSRAEPTNPPVPPPPSLTPTTTHILGTVIIAITIIIIIIISLSLSLLI